MRLTMEVADPLPGAARGTLEYAASAAACEHVVCVRMSLADARLLLIGLDVADTHGVPDEYLRPLAHLTRLLDEGLPPR